MKKITKYYLSFGAVVVVLLMVSSACAVNVVQSNKMKSNLKSESSDVEMDLQAYPEKLINSPYEIDINKMKMEEVKQLVNKEIFKNKNLLLKSILMLKVNRVFKTLYKIGINDETTVAQAREIILKNKEYVTRNAEGMNLLCFVSISTGFAGTVYKFPPIPIFWGPGLFVTYRAGPGGGFTREYGSVFIIGLLGIQEEYLRESGNEYLGLLIGFIGVIAGITSFGIVGFALFSTCRKIN